MATRALDVYRKKRDPTSTPEPFGGQPTPNLPATAPHVFVVQQHDATRMHWDVRLEIDGVLVSFAVPKGPALDPKEKRLAVQTEDHPMDYRVFEGIIPKGNYGAGAMILWDHGTYRSHDGVHPRDGLANGKLDLFFQGLKMRGRWKFVRTKGEDGKNWLLFHYADGEPPSRDELVVMQPYSVLSGLSIEELDQGVRRDAELGERAEQAGAVRKAMDVARLEPMLATSQSNAFTHADWIFEIKYDGWRVLVQKEANRRVRVFTRNGREVTPLVPEIARAVTHLPVDECVLDGEVVGLDERGVARFERIQKRLHRPEKSAVARHEFELPLTLFAFDLLFVDGWDLTTLPLITRKEMLQRLVPKLGVVRFTDHVPREGQMLFDAVREHGLEGIMAKRADSKYQAGKRSTDWVKIKAPRSVDVAVVGYLPTRGTGNDLASLMVAWRVEDKLVYAGNVGTGFDEATRKHLHKLLQPRIRKTPACDAVPKPPQKGTNYVEPELVASVRYTDITSAGILRHPVFIGLVDGKGVMDCAAPAERSPAPEPEPALEPPPPPTFQLVNQDKIFWPRDGYTKGDLLTYYEAVWPWLGPYLHNRPLVLTRYPDGVDGKNFYQKNAPPFTPEWVNTYRIEDTDYFVCNDVTTLLYVINSGAIPLHIWSARKDSLDRPDWTILDLDPKGAPLSQVIELAQHIHALLDELKAPHYLKTSGQDGLHILLPLGAELQHNEAKTLAEVLARVVVQERGDICTVARNVNARDGKIYVDFLQNGFGKLIAGPFSVRPRDGAPVSMPLHWDELTQKLNPAHHTIKTAPARLQKVGDPMAPVLTGRQDLLRLLTALQKRLKS
ncbi:MAG: DNA ligase D [Myxococcota bacterium]